MGFYFRKSVNAGPFRINFSRSGVGYSVGGRGFRTGVTPRGRRYTSSGIPGTGMGYRTGGPGCMVMLVGSLALLAVVGFAAARLLKETL
ncbi:MAG TPA: DUF4236 domain-containing protein [Phycisphaerales bacterium]|nr:DUF4236 domain-containing protein [Phycisphaerales bacterium]